MSHRTFIDELLAEQRRLDTPVTRFSEGQGDSRHRNAHVYRDLIPLTSPGPGEQYAFQVNLDACTGCKACVTACHSMNGLDEGESWRDVGAIQTDISTHPFTQTVTSSCHHCVDPACANGCPVLAYEKDNVTGIVRHLDDQCIGCSYCILKCPYDAPKYNTKRGIVRKCDMCQQRLAVGEAPACVQACPTSAISIITIEKASAVAAAKAAGAIVGGAHASSYTVPTTRYTSVRPIPVDARASDLHELTPQPPHWPLAIMLILTQAGIGFMVADALTPHRENRLLALGTVLFALGIGASVSHLGQPLKAWRAFLGLRKSWLSREIVVFGGTLASAGFFLLVRLTGTAPQLWPLVSMVVIGAGIAGVFCSAMVYHDTDRNFWRLDRSAGKFFATVLIFSLVFFHPGLAAATLTLKLLAEGIYLRHRTATVHSSAKKTALLLTGPLSKSLFLRYVIGLTAVGFLLAAPSALRIFAPVLVLASELAERSLFFRAVDAPKMPGGISS